MDDCGNAGCHESWGAFVPLDPSHPIPRLQALARSVDARLLLCSRHHVELLATVSEVVLPIDDEFINRLPVGQSTPISQVKSNNAAYLIFTSGSTGEPKVPTLNYLLTSHEDLILRRVL